MKKNIFPMVFLATGLLLSATEVLFKASFTDGGIVTEPAGLTVKTFGKPEYLEGALVLDGNGSCIQIDNPVTLNCKAAQSFTLEFSYFPEETGKKEGTYIKLFSRGSLPAHYWNLSAHLRCGTPAVKAGHRPDGKYKGLYNNLSMITPSTGKWHRIGIVRNAKLKRISFYHNGIAVHEFDDELPELFDNQDAALYIGGMPDEGTFKGKIGTIIMREGVHPVNAVTPEEIKPLPEKEVAIDPEVKKAGIS